MPHRVGDKISIQCIDRRYKEKVPRYTDTDMRQRECAYPERGGKHGPCSHACGISTVTECERFGQEIERADIKCSARGVSQSAEAILGEAFLGHRVWRMEYGSDNRRDGAGIPGAS